MRRLVKREFTVWSQKLRFRRGTKAKYIEAAVNNFKAKCLKGTFYLLGTFTRRYTVVRFVDIDFSSADSSAFCFFRIVCFCFDFCAWIYFFASCSYNDFDFVWFLCFCVYHCCPSCTYNPEYPCSLCFYSSCFCSSYSCSFCSYFSCICFDSFCFCSVCFCFSCFCSSCSCSVALCSFRISSVWPFCSDGSSGFVCSSCSGTSWICRFSWSFVVSGFGLCVYWTVNGDCDSFLCSDSGASSSSSEHGRPSLRICGVSCRKASTIFSRPRSLPSPPAICNASLCTLGGS